MGLPLAQALPPQVYPLSDLLSHIRQLIKTTYGGIYWIVAEVIEISHSRVGHYYFTLGEIRDGKVVAKVQANLWAGAAQSVLRDFEQVTGGKIDKGMQLMLQVQVDFTALYGLSLTILGINAEHTLGHLERIKRQAIGRLQAEGVLDMNKSLPLPLLPLRLAVISSDTAAGWGDFAQQIRQSSVADIVRIHLYPCIVQGEQTTPSILSALDRIYEVVDRYDALLVLRGGGSRLDLSAFDDYELCVHLAQIPIPVLSGIGHERDVSVVDMIAHTRLKTPTALADFVIRRVETALGRMQEVEQRLYEWLPQWHRELSEAPTRVARGLREILHDITLEERSELHRRSTCLVKTLRQTSQRAESRLFALAGNFQRISSREMAERKRDIDGRQGRLALALKQRYTPMTYDVSKHRHRLESILEPFVRRAQTHLDHLDSVARLYDPQVMMRRGFVPIMVEGEVLTSVAQLSLEKTMTLLLPDGKVTAGVKHIEVED